MAHNRPTSPWVRLAETDRLVAAEYSAGRPVDAADALGRRVYTVRDLQAGQARVNASHVAERIARELGR